MFARRTPLQFEGQIEALLARPDATDVLRAVSCPALVLCGREDGWAPPSQHEEMAALMPGSRLAILDRCGHMAPMERPDAVGAALVEWLGATRSAGREGCPMRGLTVAARLAEHHGMRDKYSVVPAKAGTRRRCRKVTGFPPPTQSLEGKPSRERRESW